MGALGAHRGDGRRVVRGRTHDRVDVVRAAGAARHGAHHVGLPHDGAHLGGRHLVRGDRDPARRARRRVRARAGADHAGRRRSRPGRRPWIGRRGGDGGPPARPQRRALGAHRLRSRPLQPAPAWHRPPADRRSRLRGRAACRAGDAHRRRHRRDVPDVRRRHRRRRRDRADDATHPNLRAPTNASPSDPRARRDRRSHAVLDATPPGRRARHVRRPVRARVRADRVAVRTAELDARRPRRDACRPRARRSGGRSVRVAGPGLPRAAHRARADRVGGDRRGHRRARVVQLVDARVRRGDRRERADRTPRS